jgi:O-antigen/teichoic acid export membrane protein
MLLYVAMQADRFAMMLLGDNRMLGVFVVAWTAASAIQSIITISFIKVLLPHVARSQLDRRGPAAFSRAMRHALFALVLAAVPLCLMMPWLVRVLFGATFEAAVLPAMVLTAGYLLLALKTIAIHGLRGLDDSATGTVAATVGLATFAVFVWPLFHWGELLGVCGGVVVSNLAALVYLAVRVQRLWHISLKEMWGLNRLTLRESCENVVEMLSELSPMRLRRDDNRTK